MPASSRGWSRTALKRCNSIEILWKRKHFSLVSPLLLLFLAHQHKPVGTKILSLLKCRYYNDAGLKLQGHSAQERLLRTIVTIIIFISRLPERHKPIELATINGKTVEKKTVRAKNTKSKKYKHMKNAKPGLNQTITAT